MKATAVKRYHCVCEECDPLPPVEGLHPSTHEAVDESVQKAWGLLRLLGEKIIRSRPRG